MDNIRSVKNIVTKLSQRKGCPIVLVDGYWGVGKTFLCTKAEEELKDQNLLTIKINAWEDDFFQDPLIPILAKIRKTIFEECKAENPDELKFLVRKVVEYGERVLRSNINQRIPNAWQTDSFIEAYDESKAALNFLINSLKELVTYLEITIETKKLPIVILIDELDRCRPDFALALLERTKHIVDLDLINFCFFANLQQMQHMVRRAYGEINGVDYLKRFFGYRVQKRMLSEEKFISQVVCNDSDLNKVLQLIDENSLGVIARFFNMSYRDIEDYAMLLKVNLSSIGRHHNFMMVLILFAFYQQEFTNYHLIIQRKFVFSDWIKQKIHRLIIDQRSIMNADNFLIHLLFFSNKPFLEEARDEFAEILGRHNLDRMSELINFENNLPHSSLPVNYLSRYEFFDFMNDRILGV